MRPQVEASMGQADEYEANYRTGKAAAAELRKLIKHYELLEKGLPEPALKSLLLITGVVPEIVVGPVAVNVQSVICAVPPLSFITSFMSVREAPSACAMFARNNTKITVTSANAYRLDIEPGRQPTTIP